MRRDLTWVIALAAALWGTSALLREPLARGLDAPTIVFAEHLVLLLFVSPWLVGAMRAWAASPARVRAAAVIIGAGSSALATTLFTAAFAFGDPVTPQILQKLQPLVAMMLAAVVLGERLRPVFAVFAVPALAGPGCSPSPTLSTCVSATCRPRPWPWVRRCCGPEAPCSAVSSTVTSAHGTPSCCASPSGCRLPR